MGWTPGFDRSSCGAQARAGPARSACQASAPLTRSRIGLDIVEVVGASVKLRRSGKNYVGFCPFHPNVHTPAFVVFPESGTWRCFGACNDGGDVFKFVMKKEGWDFKEALRQLAARAGVELGPREAREEADEAAHARLRQALEAAVLFYRHHLLDTEAGKPVLDYLQQRGLQAASLEAFEIGYAPHGWDATLEHLGAKGFTPQEMLDAGLLTESAAGKTYDRFRNRIMIPIRDGRGRLAGFGAAGSGSGGCAQVLEFSTDSDLRQRSASLRFGQGTPVDAREQARRFSSKATWMSSDCIRPERPTWSLRWGQR